MKLLFTPTAKTVNDYKGTLDIYPRHWPSGEITWITRKWPRKPRDTSGNFKKTHSASKLTLEAYRATPSSVRKSLQNQMSRLSEAPLDWFRSLNQSYAYYYQELPNINDVQIQAWNPATKQFTVRVFHSPGRKTIAYYMLWLPDTLPTRTIVKNTRNGTRRCHQLYRSVPPNELNPIDETELYDDYEIDDNSLVQFAIETTFRHDGAAEIVLQPDDTTSNDSCMLLVDPTWVPYPLDRLYCSGNPPPLFRFCAQFDLSSIPAGATINSAIATFTTYPYSGQHHFWIAAYRLTSAFKKEFLCWNNRDSGTPWNTPGGDFAEEIDRCEGGATDPAIFDMTNTVRGWLNGDYPNYGIITEPYSNYTFHFWCSARCADPASHPKLVVNYESPKFKAKAPPSFFPLIFNHSANLPNL